MATFTIEIPDELVTLAAAAHRRQQARVPLAQRSVLVVDEAYCRSAAIQALYAVQVGDAAEAHRASFEAAQKTLREDLDRIAGP